MFIMPNDNRSPGNRLNRIFDNSSARLQKDIESKRTIDQDSFLASEAKREANKRANRHRRYSAEELVALLPDCGKTAKSIDELIDETHSILELWSE